MKNEKYVRELDGVLQQNPDARPLVERLIARKRTLYANDLRLIGDYKLRTVDGEVRLRVEARSPYPQN